MYGVEINKLDTEEFTLTVSYIRSIRVFKSFSNLYSQLAKDLTDQTILVNANCKDLPQAHLFLALLACVRVNRTSST